MANDVVLVAVGCLSGVLAGMLGAGGGFATVALLLASGADPHVAVGTGLVYMMIMGGWGAFMHVHLRSVDRRLALVLGAAAATSALVGAQISEALPRKDLVLALGLFTACVTGVSLAWPQTRRPVELPEDALDDLDDDPEPSRYSSKSLRDALRPATASRPKVVPIADPATTPAPGPAAAPTPIGGAVAGGSLIGLLKGLFGVGGAFLIVPVMSRVGRVPREVAVGSSLFAILVASLVAALRHATLGNVDGSDLLALVPGGLFGSFVGARAARSMSRASIRRVLLAVMAASTVYLLAFRSGYR
jgi:uncharacterized protein